MTAEASAIGGVVLMPPPVERLAPIAAAIAQAIADLPAGATGALVGVANNEGMNVAVVQRVGDSFAVMAWVGKQWGGDMKYGAAARVTW